jgi:hypothetical protein
MCIFTHNKCDSIGDIFTCMCTDFGQPYFILLPISKMARKCISVSLGQRSVKYFQCILAKLCEQSVELAKIHAASCDVMQPLLDIRRRLTRSQIYGSGLTCFTVITSHSGGHSGGHSGVVQVVIQVVSQSICNDQTYSQIDCCRRNINITYLKLTPILSEEHVIY